MNSKERICKILNFQTPDRIGIHDTFLDSTIERWRRDGLPAGVPPEDYFGFDFDIFDMEEVLLNGFPEERESEKFACLSFSEPFQRLCDTFGRESVLRELALNPGELQKELISQTGHILDSLQQALQKGIGFDGAWAWGDLAYNKGLFFSLTFYKKVLLPLHKEIFQFLNSRNLSVLFHSDGQISELIPHLLEAGVRAFHPLEENSGIDIDRLLREYKDDMVFMGHMDMERPIGDRAYLNRLKEKIEKFKSNCFYIYQADCPIMPNISLEDYTLAIEAIKEYGRY